MYAIKKGSFILLLPFLVPQPTSYYMDGVHISDILIK